MITSSAEVFRKRQALSDLTASMQSVGRNAIARFSTTGDVRRSIARLVSETQRFSFPEDRHCYSDVLLAAAMPDEDFPAFVLSTCLLLTDRLLGGDGTDDLFWNWEAFADHYGLADPPVRAAIMNGFRMAEATGGARLRGRVPAQSCLTRQADIVLGQLENAGHDGLVAAIRDDVSAEEAGRLWTEAQSASPGWTELTAFRFLYERPKSMAPKNPESCLLIPWN